MTIFFFFFFFYFFFQFINFLKFFFFFFLIESFLSAPRVDAYLKWEYRMIEV